MDARPLDDFPGFVAMLGTGLVHASDHLAWSSLDRVLSGLSWDRSGHAVHSLQIKALVELSITETRRIVFWFRRRTTEPQVTMKVTIRSNLVPAAFEPVLRRDNPPLPRAVVFLPKFILRSAPEAEYRRLTSLVATEPGMPANPDTTLLLRLSSGMLAIYNTRRNGVFESERARLQYTPWSGTPILIRDRTHSNVPLHLFLDLLDVLKRWCRGELESSGSPLRLDDVDSEIDVVTTLMALANAHAALRQVASRRAVEARLAALVDGGTNKTVTSVMAWIRHFGKFDTKGFSADLTLRLDGRGNFARVNEDDPFDVAIKASIEDDDVPIMKLSVEIPDFLAVAEETRRFHDAVIADRKAVREVADALNMHEAGARAFLEENADSSVVFRLRRRLRRRSRIDDDVIAWRGRSNDIVVIAVMRLRIALDAGIEVMDFDVKYAGSATASVTLGREFDEYIQKVTTVLHRWVSLGRRHA